MAGVSSKGSSQSKKRTASSSPASTTSSPSSVSSMASTIKAYSVPLFLFVGAMFYQLFVIPKAFPSTHYDVLGIQGFASVDEIKETYEKITSNWKTSTEAVDTVDIIKVQYAYELLTNPLWKRDYDIYGFDEQFDAVERAKKQLAGRHISDVDFPLLNAISSESFDHMSNILTSKDFHSIFPDTEPWLIQLYSSGSIRCAQFSESWKRIAALLDGVAKTGMVELGEVQLATYLSEKKSTGKPFFRYGLPSLIAIPSGCKAANCLFRFEGEPSVDAVTDWFSTIVLGLPRILYYSAESLVPNFLSKTSPQKVKVIFFSKTGERAAPFIRKAAREYESYASFAFVPWREEEFSFWWKAFELESAPAIVFMKDPGVKPVVYYGTVNNSLFLNLMEHNKQQELRQLSGETSMELGCNPQGYSRAGYDTEIWYCAILAGRVGPELNDMRGIMCRVQEQLCKHGDPNSINDDQFTLPAVDACKRNRLTFAWLDGERQKDYCYFYLNPTTSVDTCGPRSSVGDVPQLFIVRYKRNSTEDTVQPQKKQKSMWDMQQPNLDVASQFVAKYNGSKDISEIIKWVSKIVEDGDSRNLPFFRVRTPELVPENIGTAWFGNGQNGPSKNIRRSIRNIIGAVHDHLDDPRIGPSLLLGALMSFGTIWMRRNRAINSARPNREEQPKSNDERGRRRGRAETLSKSSQYPSPTDVEPKDAYQMPFSDSDSE